MQPDRPAIEFEPASALALWGKPEMGSVFTQMADFLASARVRPHFSGLTRAGHAERSAHGRVWNYHNLSPNRASEGP